MEISVKQMMAIENKGHDMGFYGKQWQFKIGSVVDMQNIHPILKFDGADIIKNRREVWRCAQFQKLVKIICRILRFNYGGNVFLQIL